MSFILDIIFLHLTKPGKHDSGTDPWRSGMGPTDCAHQNGSRRRRVGLRQRPYQRRAAATQETSRNAASGRGDDEGSALRRAVDADAAAEHAGDDVIDDVETSPEPLPAAS